MYSFSSLPKARRANAPKEASTIKVHSLKGSFSAKVSRKALKMTS